MTRWKELPAGLDDAERQLVAQLRRLKDRAGLSLAALAARTSYSSSSWERYLNGKKPVPRGAAEELAELCGTPAERLLVLHEVAGTARARRTEPAPASDAADRPPGRTRRARWTRRAWWTRRSWWTARTVPAAAGAAVLVAFAAGFLAGASWHGDGGRAGTGRSAALGTSAYHSGRSYDCGRIRRANGVLTAGYATSRDVLLDRGSTGWDVVEAQCLLLRHGSSPGRVDGVYGERTGQAARAFQKRHGLVPDGIVGPDTWRELRT
ncbi:helix-turn-helix domain-containing protein [Streptomyces sp. NPDC057616]|uniref:helix-turn-helix domain-containing protein n=1 Tax=Streptomyces sp. NPDC057616 TaxID=3346183 RepID=UPI0036AA4887